MADFPVYEEHLLGQVLADPKIIDEYLISLSCFREPTFRDIFSAIITAREKEESPDDIVILDVLRRSNREHLGATLISLVRFSTGNARFYVDKLRERHQKEEVKKALAVALEAMKDETSTALEIADMAETAITNAIRGVSDEQSVAIKDVADRCFDDLSTRVADRKCGKMHTVNTGVGALDEFCSDLRAGEVVCIAARPGCGKTALAMQIANHVAGNLGKHTVIFTLEMNRSEILDRMFALAGVASVGALRSGNLDTVQLEDARIKTKMFQGYTLSVYDGTHSLELLRARIRREKAVNKTELVIIDYLGLVDIGESSKAPRWERMGELSKALKRLAQELGLIIIECVQLNRESEKDKKPTIGQLRDSGSIEQDADRILLLHPTNENETGSDRQVSIDIAKNRHGAMGSVLMNFTGSFVRFGDEKKVHEPVQTKPEPDRWDGLGAVK